MNEKSTPITTLHANEILKRINIFQNPYFERLKNGSMDKEQFLRTQEQFYFAVTFFSRPMSVLIARIPEAKNRLDILHNVLEEHGDMKEEAFHGNTFLQFLKNLSYAVDDIEKVTLCPQIRAFNNTLLSACTFDKLEVGIACLGIIEMAFADISSIIGKAVLDRGWIKEKDLIHYKLHAEIDVRHATEFFCVIEKYWNSDSLVAGNLTENQRAKKIYLIKQGLELGAYIFDRLYKDLANWSEWSEKAELCK